MHALIDNPGDYDPQLAMVDEPKQAHDTLSLATDDEGFLGSLEDGLEGSIGVPLWHEAPKNMPYMVVQHSDHTGTITGHFGARGGWGHPAADSRMEAHSEGTVGA